LTAPGCARSWTREILWEWGAAELADAAVLIASELMTNSVNACAGVDRAFIRLTLALDHGELAILVRDNHPGVPVAAHPGADDEGGRGLLIVRRLSDRCGWFPVGNGRPAKVTWAVLSEAGHAGGERHAREEAGGLADAGLAAGAQPRPVLPVRFRQAPPTATRMRAPSLVDLEILARVKVALECI
jgi:anti-sigma regulatory factor (Ser/Thr protein kinase)